VLFANIEEVFREAAARWTLIAYFALTTIFILLFASAVSLDIVNGGLAGAKLFGASFQMGRTTIDLNELVLGAEALFSGVIFVIGTFLAVFSTAHLVPRLQDKGTIDLYLSRPVGRVRLLLSRYVAGMTLAAANVIYLILAIWGIVIWKTHVVHPRFLLGGAVILLTIAILMAFSFLIGVVTSSTAVSIMSSFALAIMGAILALHDKLEALPGSQLGADTIHALYVVIPKFAHLGRATVAFVSGRNEILGMNDAFSAFASSSTFAVASLALACFLFTRKEF
jgi:ABC-type transport system involved in multi-copper enzyme maturation permease subunit